MSLENRLAAKMATEALIGDRKGPEKIVSLTALLGVFNAFDLLMSVGIEPREIALFCQKWAIAMDEEKAREDAQKS